jgi:hypothetical protein
VALSETKRTCGWLAASKKSPERRWVSRFLLFVLRLAASIVSSIAGFLYSSRVPS